jgi:uncharacterized membrane protein affecting hemolysin expression
LAAAQGIDVLNLIRTAEQLEQMKQQRQQDAANQSLINQTGQLAGTPLMDPQKNPELAEQASQVIQQFTQQPPE